MLHHLSPIPFPRSTRQRRWLAGLTPKQMSSQRERCESSSLASTLLFKVDLPLVLRREEHPSCLQGRSTPITMHSWSGPGHSRKPVCLLLLFLGHSCWLWYQGHSRCPLPLVGGHLWCGGLLKARRSQIQCLMTDYKGEGKRPGSSSLIPLPKHLLKLTSSKPHAPPD